MYKNKIKYINIRINRFLNQVIIKQKQISIEIIVAKNNLTTNKVAIKQNTVKIGYETSLNK